MISKYPPIEGGVSAQNYWLAKALGKKGHEVYISTNAWRVEDEFKEDIKKEEFHLLEPKNVSVFTITPNFRSPLVMKSDYYSERLANNAINIIKKNNIDMIYSHYMLPYGFAGFITKKITKKPHIVTPAGSDIGMVYKSNEINIIFDEIFKDADKIIGSKNLINIFNERNIDMKNLIFINKAVDTNHFNPTIKAFDFTQYIKSKDLPILTYFGKVSELKQTYAFINAASKIKKDFRIVFVSGSGHLVQKLKEYINRVGMIEKCIFLPFQPPWKIPSIMKGSLCVVAPESDETKFFPKGTHYPLIVKEAMACGVCSMIGLGVKEKGDYSKLQDENDVIVVNPYDIEQFRKKIEFVLDNQDLCKQIGKNAYKVSQKTNDFEGYVKDMENLFKSCVL
jgi:glycosyltransferase involved in cell wall biosynthesis